ncbi:hypothetical protein E4U41_006444 [Claviceps citrina]|nr:hypothetical protein E4U41_006444 [Claviceps citrina]
MESQVGDLVQDGGHTGLPSTAAQRASSGSSGSSGSGLFSKLPFMRASAAIKGRQTDDDRVVAPPVAATSQSLHAVTQQHRTRRRRGSLRKAALLGRGAQRERRDGKQHLTIDIPQTPSFKPVASASLASGTPERDALGLEIADFAPPTCSKIPETFQSSARPDRLVANTAAVDRAQARHQHNLYNSTTDEEDGLQMSQGSRPATSHASASSGSESYFAARAVAPRRRSFQQAKSPLSYSGISKNALPQPGSDWDYSETEWWGWVVLTTTWLVFVIGMGSCLNVWKWAWDVGKTPYAPPELEDDPTLPIDGYYPALIILTGVMAWVWVVVAWVGMKYFRHAKISGD